MTDDPIFTAWPASAREVWGRVPMHLTHRLAEHTLFSHDALARLLETYPRDRYNLVQWGGHGESGSWREGELGGLSGAAILDAVAKGRVWINLRNVPSVDARYGDLLDDIFAELDTRLGGFETFTRRLGILVSSPGSRTLYHADLPGQSLWQIRGRKRVYVYPRVEPFLTEAQIERVALSGVEVNMPYRPWYDEYATMFDIGPGDMLHWPLNAPHRVDNLDCLNVSMTLEYFTPDIRRGHMVTVANGILRHKLGVAPRSRAVTGPAFWSKAVLQRLLRDTPWVKRENKARRRPEFRLDPDRPGAIVDLEPA
jgi:hypothetical protein